MPEEEILTEQQPLEEEKPVEEEKPLEEPKPEEAQEEPAPEEEKPVEEVKPSPLEEALDLLMKATPEEIDALPPEKKEAYQKWMAERIPEGVAAELDWLKKAMLSFSKVLEKTLNENEDFRVLSKQVLQKNVQILEDQVKFNQFNKILKPLASICSTYNFLLDLPIEDRKLKSNIEGILEEIEAILEEYGVARIEAKEGDPFDPLSGKISTRIPTDNPDLDKKVALFRTPGFKKDRVVLVPMRADIYEYKPAE